MEFSKFAKSFHVTDVLRYFAELDLEHYSIWPLGLSDTHITTKNNPFFAVSVAAKEPKSVISRLQKHSIVMHLLKQTHGADFVTLDSLTLASIPHEDPQEQAQALLTPPPQVADAWLWTAGLPKSPKSPPRLPRIPRIPSGHAFGIYTADCIPAYLSQIFYLDAQQDSSPTQGKTSPYKQTLQGLALMHLGRKGIEAGLLRRCVKHLNSHSNTHHRSPEPATLELVPAQIQFHLHLGPAIGACCYEVPSQLAKDFCRNSQISEACISTHPHGNSRNSAEHVMLDLKLAVSEQAESLGITAQNITIEPLCTSCQAQRYLQSPASENVCYSYRRGHAQERIYTFIISL